MEAAIKEAEEACNGGSNGECATAWDTVCARMIRYPHTLDRQLLTRRAS